MLSDFYHLGSLIRTAEVTPFEPRANRVGSQGCKLDDHPEAAKHVMNRMRELLAADVKRTPASKTVANEIRGKGLIIDPKTVLRYFDKN